MSKGPRFSIARSAYDYIADATLDMELYVTYLRNRGASEVDIDALHVAIDDAYMPLGAQGVFLPRDTNDSVSRRCHRGTCTVLCICKVES